MSLDETLLDSIQPFFDKGLITDILQELKSGKEATVFACAGGPRLRGRMVAVKVYRELEHRQFRSDAAYRAGRDLGRLLSKRTARAISNKSDFGKEAAFGMWVATEWQHLSELHSLGLPVPRPLDRTEKAIAMDYLGDAAAPAPQLRSVKLAEGDALRTWDRLANAVKRMLTHNRIHGDLSPYNVLWWESNPWIIDVPQMIDPREHPTAREFLTRDLENLWTYLKRYAPLPDPWRLADALWHRWREGTL